MRSRQSFPIPAVPNHPSRPDVSHSGPSSSPSRPLANINGTSYAAPQPPSTPSNPPLYRAPAHKHAHHLHTIPPREKSTRTLIIDHLLWVHARTRFAQARCELAMTDRSSPAPTAADRNALRVPSSRPAALSSTHNRERPETFDEDDEAPSDGEDVSVLLARAGGPGHPHDDEEDEREARQDLRLARALRVRAEGIERVITSMLEQPPQDYPFPTDEPVLAPPPSSPRLPSSHGLGMSKHMLPNGVRLRLALATVINELFARQARPTTSARRRGAAVCTSQLFVHRELRYGHARAGCGRAITWRVALWAGRCSTLGLVPIGDDIERGASSYGERGPSLAAPSACFILSNSALI
ncbi:hypothetical protein EWM64_g9323 [Hericium alpestre]|uniref:Uncharacterized protein n=1 Tax=Hericium alpestre TaxID=135208 RepID=A0A4Y9ZMM7_9AGAM|nr:hypothetical protein EWM64_g9323 [Hericium alpestre]